jgi:hypothetical protein
MMKRVVLLCSLVATVTTGVAAQEPARVEAPRVTVFTSDSAGRVEQATAARVAVETRVTRGAPYSADAITEFVQVLADGNRIVRRTTTRLVRDSEGRTRRETIGQNGAVESVVITDPVAGSSFTLNPAARTARRAGGSFAVAGAGGRGGGTRAMVVSPGAAAAGRGREVAVEPTELERRKEIESRTRALQEQLVAINESTRVAVAAGGRAAAPTAREQLGQQTLEGVAATGTRETTTIAAGSIGNENPITIVSEQWYSNDLQMLILTKHSDPRSGETTYRVTNISRNEPDASLFQVPSDYTIQELNVVRPKPPGDQQ